MQFLRHYLLALQFFTRIPVTGRLAAWVGFSPDMLRASVAHFPGVGWLVGAIIALVTWVLLCALPPGGYAPLVAAVLGTVLSVCMTGAFHEDGLADVADGLGGSYDRARALEIMKDSRVGAFGAIAVALALLAKVALLALLGGMSETVLVVAVGLGHVVSRTWPLGMIALLPHVGDVAGSKSKPLADQISTRALLVGIGWCFMALALVVYAQAAIHFIVNFLPTDHSVVAGVQAWQAVALWLACGLMGSALAFVGLWRWFARRLQGFTGDCLGATQQVTELAFYLGLALGWRVLS